MRLVSYLSPGFPESLFTTFGRVLDATVRFERTMSGPHAGDDPFVDGRVDLGWVCSTSYVDLSLRSAAPSVQLGGVAWVPDDPEADDRPVYFGDLVVPSSSPVRSFDDLAGRTVACNDPVSLSGHWAFRLALADRGLDASFADLRFTGGHHTSLDQVLAGAVDAAVVDSVVRIGRARRDPAVAGLRLVERLGPFPVQPLVARADLAGEVVDAAKETLLAAADRRAVVTELRAASLRRLVPIGPDHYAGVRDALAALA